MNRRMAKTARAVGVVCLAVVVALGLPTPVAAADEISDGQWYVPALRLTEAQKITKGKGVIVAVIDTGVDPAHPDLAGSVIPGADFSNIGNPGTPDSKGLTDIDGHGTAMASLIAGHGRIQGVAPEATIMAVRDNTGGSSSTTAKALAVDWAVAHGAHVISISQAGDDNDSPALREAIAKAVRSNIVVVAGAGNVPLSTRVGYPAAYDGVLAVGGTGKDGSHAEISVTGSQIRIAAPCDQISTARHNKQWKVASGTSNSTALVAGAAALIRAKYPNLHARDVVNRLTATAIDKGAAGRDSETGYGLVNITAALTADIPLLPPETQTPATSAPSQTEPTDEPLAAPGAEFPVMWAVVAGLGCLAVTALIFFLLWRGRRHRNGGTR